MTAQQQEAENAFYRNMAANLGLTYRAVPVPSLLDTLKANATRFELQAAEYEEEANERIAAHLAAKASPRPSGRVVPGKSQPVPLAPASPVPAANVAGYVTRVHESSHAAAGIALGLRVIGIHADADLAEVRFESMGRDEVNAAVSAAGYEGERLICENLAMTWQEFSESVDMQYIRAATRNVFDEMRAAEVARRIIHERRPAILRIAAALQTCTTLTESEVLNLYRG